ncbi:DPP IV N-terminal domain-containing protein, partial [Xanthomonas perforans]|nr:DPP IV N-terminal domain-containing protein [Xanthomonas perforans]
MLPLTLLLLATTAHAQSAAPLTIEQAMADPDWIGPAVDQAWWQWDGKQVQYLLKRDGSPVRDTYRQGTGGGTAERVADTARAGLDAANPSYDATRQRMLFARNGDIFLRDLRTGALTQLTRSNETESRPQFASDGGAIWRAGNNWYHWRADGGTAQVAVVKAERDPNAAPKADVLREQQLATLATLRRDKEQRDALRTQEDAWRRADATRAAAPVYLGDEVEIVDSALSPDGRHLLVVTQAKNADEGQAGKMPRYVTESGYEEFQEVRTRVGRNAPAAHALWLVDVGAGTARSLSFDPLPGIATDPLAALRKAAKRDPLKGNRAVRVESDGDGSGPAVHWSDDGRNVAVEIRAVDNKDRWIASVDLDNARLQPRHRLSDSAWINWDFNDFGWLPDNRTLWLLSEESGYSQLYTVEGNGKPRQRTRGKWEVSMPVPSADGSGMFFLCNQKWPGDYEVCKLDLRNDQLTEITALNGVEGFSLSPNGQQLLVRYSGSYLPTQLAVVPATGGQATVLTDTRTAAFKAQPWIAPQYVQIPSKHGAGTVWGKYYGPKT